MKIVVALDNLAFDSALDIAKTVRDEVWGFKVNDLLVQYGIEAVSQLKDYGNVFADPKLHDIPATVHNSAKRLYSAGADIITVHASGGVKMLTAAMNAVGSKCQIAGVTCLTSLEESDILEIYVEHPIFKFSKILKESHVPLVVCSGDEVNYWQHSDFKTIVPGFRPFGAVPGDDQSRVCNKTDSDYVVIGRPITLSTDPLETIKNIKDKCKKDQT